MFLSYEHIKYLGYDKTTGKYRDEYKIIDTDFEEVVVVLVVVEVFVLGVAFEVEVVVIEIYRKRNLPVVPNLIRFWKYHSKKYGYTIEEQIGWYRQYNPCFAEYEEEINKYLLLL